MNAVTLAIKTYIKQLIKRELKAAQKFFSKSFILIALVAAALYLLDPLLQKFKKYIQDKINELYGSDSISGIKDPSNITDDEIKNYVKNNKELQKLLNFVSNSINQSAANEIDTACDKPDYYDKKQQEIVNAMSNNISDNNEDNSNGNDIINATIAVSDFDEETDKLDLSKLQDILNSISGVLPWLFLICFIILSVKDLLTKTEHPSSYRGKYLQRLCRYVGAALKQQLKSLENSAKNEVNAVKTGISSQVKGSVKQLKQTINGFLGPLKVIDAIVLAVLAGTLLYIKNRKSYQKESIETLSQITKETTCQDINLDSFDVSINYNKINYDVKNNIISNKNLNLKNNACETNPSEEPLVPHEPFELKSQRAYSCEEQQSQSIPDDVIVDDNKSNDLATKALISNNSSKKFDIKINVNDKVTSLTILGILGQSRIYSPIDGIVFNIENENLYIKDIKDSKNETINELIVKLQNLYVEQNNIKLFINDFYISSIYPIMLNNCPLNDASINTSEFKKIIYSDGGITERFNVAKDNEKTARDLYDKNIKDLTGEDNVKAKAENEQTQDIKDGIDKEQDKLFSSLKLIYDTAISQSKVTLPNESEFILIDYYFDLYKNILAFYDQNIIVTQFKDNINKFLIERYFVDKWDTTKLKEKINSICNDLSKGTFLEGTLDYYNKMLEKYKVKYKLDDVKDYIDSLDKDNSEFSKEDIDKMKEKVMYIFDLSLQINKKIESKYWNSNKYKQTSKESNYIEDYFKTLFERYDNIPKEIDDLLIQLNDLNTGYLTSYSIKEIDGEQYRYYSLVDDPNCKVPEETDDDYINPDSTYGYGDLEYWKKYCNYATLASVTNPITGWSTGIPPPLGPLLLPVIYLPISVFPQDWGVIVLGITICGLWIFPFVLVVNFSTMFNMPFIDPVKFIKDNINAIKYEINNDLQMLKNITLKTYLNRIKDDVNYKKQEIRTADFNHKRHKQNKPKKDRKKKFYKVIYAKDLAVWTAEEAIYIENGVSLRTDLFMLQVKYAIVYDAFLGSEIQDFPDPTVKTVKQTQKQTNDKFAKLNKMINSLDDVLAPLPNSVTPVSANFLITVKNPLPVINISDELSDAINSGDLDKITEKFKLTNNDFSSPNFKVKSKVSITNWVKYKQALKVAMFVLIKKDPFPKYQNLKIKNVKWLYFLYNDFIPTGAKAFGFPGFPPLPT